MGEVKLVDFGLAKATSQLEQTDPGVVKGKFSYLSPEAASGLEVDYRADIFACGILLFEMLTGRRLFYGETDYQTVELVRQAQVPSLTALNPEIPLELDRIVHRALARDPAQRFQHAYELQDALAQFLFSRSLKVTNRDIAQLVRECIAERQQHHPSGLPDRQRDQHADPGGDRQVHLAGSDGDRSPSMAASRSPRTRSARSGAFDAAGLHRSPRLEQRVLDRERRVATRRAPPEDVPEVHLAGTDARGPSWIPSGRHRPPGRPASRPSGAG